MWERYFCLEEKLRRLTQMTGVLGYLVFDCCRDNPCEGENIDAKKPTEIKPLPKPKVVEDESSEEETKESTKKHDFLKRAQDSKMMTSL